MGNTFTLDSMRPVWEFDKAASVSIELALDGEPLFIVDSPRYAIYANFIGRWEATTLAAAAEQARIGIARVIKRLV